MFINNGKYLHTIDPFMQALQKVLQKEINKPNSLGLVPLQFGS